MIKENKIRKLYNNTDVGFTGVNIFHNKLFEFGINIDLDELKTILSKEESYTMNRPVKAKFATRKVIVYYVYEQLQTDLIFMDTKQYGLASQNNNYKYLLTVIDVLSKYTLVVPLKDKTSTSVTEAFESILEKTKP